MSDAEVTQASLDDAVFRPVRAGNSLEDTTARLMQTIRLGVVQARLSGLARPGVRHGGLDTLRYSTTG